MGPVQVRSKGLVIIPCYNEAAGVSNLIKSFHSYSDMIDIVVIDDGSTDQTKARAKEAGATVLALPANLGIGGAVQTGIIYANRKKYPYAVQMDGDGQHPASELIKLIDAFNQDPADLIVGSRFLKNMTDDGAFRSTFMRRLGIRLIRISLRFWTGLKISDPTSGFRLMGPKALEIFSTEYSSDFPEPISYATIFCHNLKIKEIPVHMRAREHGSSSIQGLKAISYMLRVTLLIAFNSIVERMRR
jgi:glycosyltransferase involved in cell wall biosynthesis